jgi:hypothetical protein
VAQSQIGANVLTIGKYSVRIFDDAKMGHRHFVSEYLEINVLTYKPLKSQFIF